MGKICHVQDLKFYSLIFIGTIVWLPLAHAEFLSALGYLYVDVSGFY